MTRIAFHVNAADKAHYACRLIRKASVRHGVRIVVICDDAMLPLLDDMLWQWVPTEFIAHCRADAPSSILERSPVVLVPSGMVPPVHRELLINLAAEVPTGFEDFERLIDVVSNEEDDRAAGRSRWRHYLERGHKPDLQDLAPRG